MPFLYDGADVIAEYDETDALLRRYVHGPGFDEPLVWYEGTGTGDRRFLLSDPRGSVVAVTDGAGDVTTVNKYDDYGAPASGNLGRFQFTGQMWLEEAGLYHYKARAYHPALGRFMQADPIGYGDGLNMYAYVGGDPVNFIDPSGLAAGSVLDEIIVQGQRQRVDYGPSLPGHVWPDYQCGATCWSYSRSPSPGVSFGDYGWVQGGGARGSSPLGGEVSGGGGGRAGPGARPGRSTGNGRQQGRNGPACDQTLMDVGFGFKAAGAFLQITGGGATAFGLILTPFNPKGGGAFVALGLAVTATGAAFEFGGAAIQGATLGGVGGALTAVKDQAASLTAVEVLKKINPAVGGVTERLLSVKGLKDTALPERTICPRAS